MDNKGLVINLLQKHKEGLTISEIASKLNISRNTVAVYVAELKGAKKIWIRSVGMAKLIYMK